MTKPTQETLREAVARAIYLAYANRPDANWLAVEESHKEAIWRRQADAAIATMFERLRTPSDDMIQAGDTSPKPSEFVWQAMLTAFQQENSDGR